MKEFIIILERMVRLDKLIETQNEWLKLSNVTRDVEYGPHVGRQFAVRSGRIVI